MKVDMARSIHVHASQNFRWVGGDGQHRAV